MVIIRNEPNHCVYCGSDNISAGHVDQEWDIWSRDVECNHCGRRWVEFARVHAIDIPDELFDLYKEQLRKEARG